VRVLLMLPVLWVGLAEAQAPLPSVTPFPLDLKRTPSSFTKKDSEELQKDLVRLMRKVVLVPDTGSLEAAWKELKRQDCDREDECLRQLAQKAQTLYATYVQLEYSTSGQVIASGRVVRDDGRLVAGPQTVTVVKGKDPFKDVAKVAMVRLFDELKLNELPLFRPLDKPPEVPLVTVPPEHTDPLPNRPPEVQLPKTMIKSRATERTVGWVAAGVGAAVAITGGVLIGSSGLEQVNQPREVVAAHATQQRVGAGLLVGGAVVAAGGAIFALLMKDQSVVVSMSPVAGGATVVVGGSF
jgi:hypothetical protein